MQTLDTFSSSVIVNEISSKDFSLHCDLVNDDGRYGCRHSVNKTYRHLPQF
jgi:hypothetical protein